MNGSDVRAFIARTILGDHPAVSTTLGAITLRPHQLAAARRLRALLEVYGGALLADPVGTGKTYVALAVLASSYSDALVIAPAALRDMWREALVAAGVSARIVSHESLSRGDPAPARASFVIIDEAHRLRNPATRRYGMAAELCRQARVLLLSATPVQNSRNDLASLLALFLGRRAWSLDDDALAAFVARDTASDEVDMPEQIGPVSITLDVDDDWTDELTALPPPIPARDESVAAALLTFSLVHQWTSSRAALAASLRRRRTRARAMLDALESGQVPSRAELASWTHLGDAMQLAFPELVVESRADAVHELDALREAVEAHRDGVERLLAHMSSAPDPDHARVRVLRDIRRRHPDECIIAFCHYSETVAALRDFMRADHGVAALTASGGRVAGGRVSRGEILRQFTPVGRERTPRTERIDLLLTTDVLSEGLNLQAASVVVHLDLPWNPARLEQRVGRVRRHGSPHSTVTVYALAPPASAERLLCIDERLRDKLRVARGTIGIAGQILPSPIAYAANPSRVESDSAVMRRLRSWMDATAAPTMIGEAPFVGACRGRTLGFLALVDNGTLVAKLHGELTTAPARVLDALQDAESSDTDVDERFLTSTLLEIDDWLKHRRGAAAIDFGAAAALRSRRAALARVSRALARAPRHRRAQLAPLAEAARNVAAATLAEGAERVLDLLVQADLPDEAWLRSIAAFGELNVRRRAPVDADRAPRVVAIILFQPASL